jgi:hypothetical protein
MNPDSFLGLGTSAPTAVVLREKGWAKILTFGYLFSEAENTSARKFYVFI